MGCDTVSFVRPRLSCEISSYAMVAVMVDQRMSLIRESLSCLGKVNAEIRAIVYLVLYFSVHLECS